MRDSEATTALREALQFLIGSDLPAQHKRVLVEAVTQALRAGRSAEIDLEAKKPTPQEWLPQETERIAAFLHEKVAGSWQHADEILIGLAGELRRAPDDVRRKAIELGFGVGVDYRLAKRHAVTKEA